MATWCVCSSPACACQRLCPVAARPTSTMDSPAVLPRVARPSHLPTSLCPPAPPPYHRPPYQQDGLPRRVATWCLCSPTPVPARASAPTAVRPTSTMDSPAVLPRVARPSNLPTSLCPPAPLPYHRPPYQQDGLPCRVATCQHRQRALLTAAPGAGHRQPYVQLQYTGRWGAVRFCTIIAM